MQPSKISFEQVVDVIVEVSGIPREKITPASRLEVDLGVTGDDGVELLEALADKFGTDFDRPDHKRTYLFHSEGWPRGKERVIPITAGDLHLAVTRGQWEDPPWPTNLTTR